MATASDNFARADNTDIGTNWTPLLSSSQIKSQVVYGNNGAAGECAEYYNAISPGAAQYAQGVTSGTAAGGGTQGVGVRMSETDNYYGFYSDNGGKYLFKVVAGGFTSIASSATVLPSGSTIRLEAAGTTIRPMLNGVTDPQLGSQTDSAHASGNVGLAGWGVWTGSNQGIDDWEGGDLDLAFRGGTAASSVGTIFSTGSATLTLGATAQIGDLLVVTFAITGNRTVSSIQTNNAESLTLLDSALNAGSFINTFVYWKVLTSTASNVTVTLSGSLGTDCGIWGGAYTGASVPSVAGSTATDITDTGTTQDTGNVTTTTSVALLIAALSGDAARTVSTADADYVSAVATTGSFFAFVTDYRILAATETNNHSVVLNAGMNSAHVLGALIRASGGGTRKVIFGPKP